MKDKILLLKNYIANIPRDKKIMGFKALLFFLLMCCGFTFYEIKFTKENILQFFQSGDIQRSIQSGQYK